MFLFILGENQDILQVDDHNGVEQLRDAELM
jgi:hypothetical protein